MAEEDPKRPAALKDLKLMRENLDEGVVNLRATLQAQLELAEARLQDGSAIANIWLNRGSPVVASAWQRCRDGAAEIEATKPIGPSRRDQEVS